jgi:uncharacterized phage infection (PIP) family protein YhgE
MGLIVAPVLSMLKAVPFWVWLLVAALVWGGVQRYKANSAAQTYQQAQIEAAKRTEAALAENIRETARRLAKQQEATQHADAKTTAARADAAAAHAAAERLRQRLDAVRAAEPRASDPAAAGASTADRLADVLVQCVDEYRGVAAAADRAIIAGKACEASYKALMP